MALVNDDLAIVIMLGLFFTHWRLIPKNSLGLESSPRENI
jgi:hypothetical protein